MSTAITEIAYRTCSKCGEPKPTGDYMRHKAACRACRTATQRTHYERNRETLNERARKDVNRRKKRYHLRQLYNLSPEEYDAMLAAQGGVCGICCERCPSGRNLAVDHDHETGKVRGLLCSRCNVMLGMARDATATLMRAASYLEAHRG